MTSIHLVDEKQKQTLPPKPTIPFVRIAQLFLKETKLTSDFQLSFSVWAPWSLIHCFRVKLSAKDWSGALLAKAPPWDFPFNFQMLWQVQYSPFSSSSLYGCSFLLELSPKCPSIPHKLELPSQEKLDKWTSPCVVPFFSESKPL